MGGGSGWTIAAHRRAPGSRTRADLAQRARRGPRCRAATCRRRRGRRRGRRAPAPPRRRAAPPRRHRSRARGRTMVGAASTPITRCPRSRRATPPRPSPQPRSRVSRPRRGQQLEEGRPVQAPVPRVVTRACAPSAPRRRPRRSQRSWSGPATAYDSARSARIRASEPRRLALVELAALAHELQQQLELLLAVALEEALAEGHVLAVVAAGSLPRLRGRARRARGGGRPGRARGGRSRRAPGGRGRS